jgi:hypothetical protein
MGDVRHGGDPFPWWVAEGFAPAVPPDAIPGPEWDGWEARYNNDLERHKRTTRHTDRLPAPVRDVFAAMRSAGEVRRWRERTGIPDLEDDPTLHGGGLHVTDPGGHLACHLDYARHPLMSDRERRLNLILFLNPEWDESWGGALCLCDPGGNVVERIYPAPGRLAAFVTDDLSYHGVEPVKAPGGWTCPGCSMGLFEPKYASDGGYCQHCAGGDPPDPKCLEWKRGWRPVPPRVTAAVYYLSALRPGVTRRRALFMPAR